MAHAELLGVPAVRQVLARMGKSEKDEQHLIEKIERCCKKFDHAGKGSLTIDDYFNVIRIQNNIQIDKDEVSLVYMAVFIH